MKNNETSANENLTELQKLGKLIEEMAEILGITETDKDADDSSDGSRIKVTEKQGPGSYEFDDIMTSPLLLGIKLLPEGDKKKIGLIVRIGKGTTPGDIAAFLHHFKLAYDKLFNDYVINKTSSDVNTLVKELSKEAREKYSNFID